MNWTLCEEEKTACFWFSIIGGLAFFLASEGLCQLVNFISLTFRLSEGSLFILLVILTLNIIILCFFNYMRSCLVSGYEKIEWAKFI